MKEKCQRMQAVTTLAVKQGLPAEAVKCPQANFCDGIACPPSMVDIFDARMEKTTETVRRLEDARIAGKYYSNGDKI